MIETKKKENNNSIKNAIEFYMMANNLKYITDAEESIADHIYGSMILATAINSEYNLTNDLPKVLRTILLSKMYNYNRERMERYLTQNLSEKHNGFMSTF